jgi:hypothetical protein
MVADPSKCRERPLPCVSRVTKDGCVGTASTQVGAGSASGFLPEDLGGISRVWSRAPSSFWRPTGRPASRVSSRRPSATTPAARVSRNPHRDPRGARHIASRPARHPRRKPNGETREIVTRHKMDELRTSWGGVFPPMHRAVIEDGEHKRKREDEHDPSIREGAEGEYGSPQDRALAQRRRRFSKSRAR